MKTNSNGNEISPTARGFAHRSRRDFLRVGSAAAIALASTRQRHAFAAAPFPPLGPKLPPIAVFSKFYQELKLDYDQSADVTTLAGLDGVDCAVRPGGEIAPERAADDMHRYADALGKYGTHILLLTTGITSVDSPHAHDILEAGKKLGIRDYRLGNWMHDRGTPAKSLVAKIQSALKDLAAVNRQLGMCAMIENHSAPAGHAAYAGGDLDEMYDIVKDFDPKQVGVAFDLGHAIITHGDDWSSRFERLKDYIRVVYIKDLKRPDKFVRFGDGEFARLDFFRRLQKLNYSAPLVIHIEYDWVSGGKKTRAAMIETLRQSREAVANWWQHAERS